MPGDLSNPEFLFPYHYDPRYEPGSNVFESGPLNVEQIIQAISRSINGRPLSREQLLEARGYLESKHLLNKSPGDGEVQEAITKYIKSKNSAGKVARVWLTLIDY